MTAKAKTPPRVDTSRTYADHLTAPTGRHVTRGTELTVDGIRGRVTFLAHVRHIDGAEWVDVITSKGRSRSVRPDAIRVVHTRRKVFTPA